jgi:hypothetical protein
MHQHVVKITTILTEEELLFKLSSVLYPDFASQIDVKDSTVLRMSNLPHKQPIQTTTVISKSLL